MNQDIETRIVSIDIMRGFAIFGIFIVNMMAFHSPFLYLDPQQWWDGRLDRLTYIFIDVFAQASFYPLFSLLFGYSFVWLREKAINRGLSFLLLAVRRLLFLLFIGLIHAFFIWHGDILFEYAILGFFLLFFLHMPGRTLLYSGLFLYGIPTFLLNVLLAMSPTDGLNIFNNHATQQSLEIYQQGTFAQITNQRITDWLVTNNLNNFPFLVISIFSLFLIGAGVAKLKWLERPNLHRKKLSFILTITFVGGLLLKLTPYLFSREPLTEYLQESVGGVCLAIAYGLVIVKGSDKLCPLAAVGRMSLSNYLFQSVVSTLIFYGYGLGLYGKISLFSGTILTSVIFVFQIAASHYWLRRFRYGPVESVWRKVTYLKRNQHQNKKS